MIRPRAIVADVHPQITKAFKLCGGSKLKPFDNFRPTTGAAPVLIAFGYLATLKATVFRVLNHRHVGLFWLLGHFVGVHLFDHQTLDMPGPVPDINIRALKPLEQVPRSVGSLVGVLCDALTERRADPGGDNEAVFCPLDVDENRLFRLDGVDHPG